MSTPPQRPIITIPITGEDLKEYQAAAEAVGEEVLHRMVLDVIRDVTTPARPALQVVGKDEEESE